MVAILILHGVKDFHLTIQGTSMASKISTDNACPLHADDTSVLYCITCDHGVCLKCITANTHGLHKLCQMHEIVEINRREFQEIVENNGIDNIRKSVQEHASKMKEQQNFVQDQGDKMVAAIEERSTHLVSLIEDLKLGLISRSKTSHDQHLKVLNEQETNASRYLSYIDNYCKDPDSFLRTQDDQVTQMLKMFQGLEASDTAPQGQKESLATFVCGKDVTKVTIHNLFGTLKEPTRIDHCEQVAMLKFKYNKVSPFYTKEFNITKISPIDKNTAFVLRGDGTLFKVCIGLPEKEMNNHKPILSDIEDMTPVSDKGLYLCGKSGIQLYTLDGRLFNIDRHSQNDVRCICLTKDGHLMFSSQQNEKNTTRTGEGEITYNTIHKMDTTGILVKSGRRVQQTGDAHHYRIEEHKEQVCTITKDSQHGVIQSYSLDASPPTWPNPRSVSSHMSSGRKADTYSGKIGLEHDKSFDPSGICFDQDNNIIIADCKNSALHLLKEDWKFDRFLMREWDGLKNPTTIALDKFEQLWIGQQDGIIQIMKYSP